MSKNTKKDRKPRATPAEVLASFTREDITACIAECETLRTRKRKLERRLTRVRTQIEEGKHTLDADTLAEMMDDVKEDKTTLRDVSDKLTYKAGKVRRAALAMFKTNTDLFAFVSANIEMIPSADDKMGRTSFVQNVTTDSDVLEMI